MIASIISAVAIALMAVAIFLLSARVKEVESDTEDIDKVKKALHAQQKFISDIESDLGKCEARATYAEGSVETIFKKLEGIIADIHRLDEEDQKNTAELKDLVKRIDTVAKDEKDIRSYYVNFREPNALPTFGGVPWAKDYKTGEDND